MMQRSLPSVACSHVRPRVLREPRWLRWPRAGEYSCRYLGVATALLSLVVMMTGCGADRTDESPPAIVRVGSQTSTAGPDCGWLNAQSYGLFPLAVGFSQGDRIVSLRLVDGASTCPFDRRSTARTLVAIAMGAPLSPPTVRESIWATTADIDTRGIESILTSGDLESVLEDAALRSNLLSEVARTADASMAARVAPAGVEPDPRGLDGLAFGAPVLTPDASAVDIAASADNSVLEIRSLLVADAVQGYLKGEDMLDPLVRGAASDGAHSSLTLHIPVGAGLGDHHVGIHVVAPAWLDFNPAYDLIETRESFKVDQRSIAGYGMQALLFLLPDVFSVAVDSRCGQAVATALGGIAESITTSVAQNATLGEFAWDLLNAIGDAGPDLVFECGRDMGLWARFGTLVAFTSAVSQRVGFTKSMLRSFFGGAGLAIHQLDLCDACGGDAPSCTIDGAGLHCGSSCAPAWSCGNWSACDCTGTQNRSCNDANNCGTQPPALQQACTPPTSCCTPQWTCSDWTACDCTGQQMRSCSDANHCGAASPPVVRSCAPCGDGNCSCGESWSTCPADCSCTPNVSVDCDGGDRYWFDSCGNRGALEASCGGCGCTGGLCDQCPAPFHFETTPPVASFTPTFTPSTSCTCGPSSCTGTGACGAYWRGRVTSIGASTVSLEFATGDGMPLPGVMLSAWLGVGATATPSCTQMSCVPIRWSATSVTPIGQLRWAPPPIDMSSLASAPCGAAENLYLMTGSAAAPTTRTWFQPQAITVRKVCP
jgi:hypothetical protein